MGQVTIEAFEDRTRADGGHAIILLTGLKEVPHHPAFRLRPAGLEQDSDLPFAWPEGELLPATAKVTSRGVELVVGPDIAENPLLTAGTPLEIVLTEANIHGEFLWPAIQPMARPKRRSLVARAAPRDERLESIRRIEQPEAPARTESHRHSIADRGEPANTRKEQTAMSESSHEAAPATVAASGAENLQKRDNAEFVTFYPHARGGRLNVEKKARTAGAANFAAVMPNTPGGMAAAIIAGVILVQGLLVVARSGPSVNPAALATTPLMAIDNKPQPQQSDQLFEALASGPTSPRGVNGRDTSGNRALETAQTMLQGPDSSRDTEEGAFWLKRYLQGALGDERTLRALTHLGSAYAEPTGRAPDYTKARLVWEMAGALGDPVAMCMLGIVHENGLGVVRDKKKALPWYERAKTAGGCANVDESIARVRQ